MYRYVLVALMTFAFGASTGCNKVTTDTKSDETKKDKDKDKKDKKKGDDDDDDDDKASAKKKKGDDDDDDDDDKPAKKKKGDDDDDDSSSFDTGMPECDEYLALYKKCTVDTAPKSMKDQLAGTMKTLEKTYKDSAKSGGGAGKSAVADSCKTTAKQLKKTCKE